MLRTMLTVGLLLIGLPLAARAAEPEGSTEKVIRCKISDAKKTCGAACSVNFMKELGLPLDYLGSIGHRISMARKAPDPVELALAAQALGVAEKVSGKTASITADSVRAESLELARMRGVSNELAAIAMIESDADTKRELEKLTAVAKKREAEEKTRTKSGESEKELIGTLTVINHSGECLRIMVSGRYVGTVHEGETGYFRVHDHNDPTQLEAYCEEEGELVRQGYVFGHRHRATWHID